jgi:hypothetical protein
MLFAQSKQIKKISPTCTDKMTKRKNIKKKMYRDRGKKFKTENEKENTHNRFCSVRI